MRKRSLEEVEYASGFCFACGQNNPIGLKLKFTYDGEKVNSEFTPQRFHEGWAGFVHGGILYTILDEANAYAILCYGLDCVTGTSEVKFRHPAPIGEPIQITAQLTRKTHRAAKTKAVLTLKDGTIIAENTSLFYIVGKTRIAIIWDMDGVLVDSASFHFAAWQEVFSRRGVKFTEEEFIQLFGSRNDFIVRSILGQNIPEEDINAITQEKELEFRNAIKGRAKLLPGVSRLLDMMKGNLKMALASSAPKENIDLISSELHMEGYFDCVVSGHEVAESKPSPEIYSLAAQRLQTNPGNCLVIEDSPLGVKAAKAAGMKCLAVSHNHPQQDMIESTVVVNTLEDIDLLSLLKIVWKI
jgi:beta-phosphoglucomutase